MERSIAMGGWSWPFPCVEKFALMVTPALDWAAVSLPPGIRLDPVAAPPGARAGGVARAGSVRSQPYSQPQPPPSERLTMPKRKVGGVRRGAAERGAEGWGLLRKEGGSSL